MQSSSTLTSWCHSASYSERLSSCSLVPRPLSAFLTCRKKTRGGLVSKVTCQTLHYSWHDAIRKVRPITGDFKPVGIFQFMKCCSVKPQRIVLHSPKALDIMSFTRVELERLKIWLAHGQFSRSATLPTYPSIWAYVTHVILDPRLPFFRACS